MIKLNNKGFAISTLLYGLMIMIFLIVFALMSIMGSNRKNTKNLVDVIEDELTRYSLTNVYGVYDSSIDDGSGRLYIAPSSGWYKIELWGAKGGTTGTNSNNGYYLSGSLYLEENNHLYIYLGNDSDSDSHINLSNEEESTIMLAPGGTDGTETQYILNGNAGTELNDSGEIKTKKIYNIKYGAFDEEGNAIPTNVEKIFYDTLIVPHTNNGLSKFRISKISDNDSTTLPKKTEKEGLKKVRYIKDCIKGSSINQANHWVELQALQNGENVAYKKNITLSVSETGVQKEPIEAITDGKASDTFKYYNYDASTYQEACITVDLQNVYDLDEIAVWHYYNDNRRYKDHTLHTSSDNSNWHTVSKSSSAYNEERIGMRYSVYQQTEFDKLEQGTYYIFSNPIQNGGTLTNDGDRASLKPFTGDKNQQWIITSLGNNKWSIKSVQNDCVLTSFLGGLYCTSYEDEILQKWSLTLAENNYNFIFNSEMDISIFPDNYSVLSLILIGKPSIAFITNSIANDMLIVETVSNTFNTTFVNNVNDKGKFKFVKIN